MNLSKINTLLIASFFLFLTATVISHPQASFEASKTGLSMWWEVVFPSLLPFFYSVRTLNRLWHCAVCRCFA